MAYSMAYSMAYCRPWSIAWPIYMAWTVAWPVHGIDHRWVQIQFDSGEQQQFDFTSCSNGRLPIAWSMPYCLPYHIEHGL